MAASSEAMAVSQSSVLKDAQVTGAVVVNIIMIFELIESLLMSIECIIYSFYIFNNRIQYLTRLVDDIKLSKYCTYMGKVQVKTDITLNLVYIELSISLFKSCHPKTIKPNLPMNLNLLLVNPKFLSLVKLNHPLPSSLVSLLLTHLTM
ncbi:hypothetical protein BDA99DRAFT_544473 [Phascolomyces articulosus]|uniref:Uncharacterized protein n=1 Tax=Phascolomyces articulosus TaxID=60185 RepID=A0AAD5JVX0_9FUNG|nr:hypothetical protein BDA99DRAFT_544473 [Phascolomyces articulosus]